MVSNQKSIMFAVTLRQVKRSAERPIRPYKSVAHLEIIDPKVDAADALRYGQKSDASDFGFWC